MSRFSRFELVSHSPSHYLNQTSILRPPRTLALNHFFPSFPIVEDELDCALGLLDLAPASPSLFDEFGTITDLIQIDETPFHTSTRRVTRRAGLGDLYLQALSDRVSALELELGLSRLAREEKSKKKQYTWTAEVKSPENDRKYQWTAEINDGKKGQEKSYKLTAEIHRKGGARVLPLEQKYTIKVSTGGSEEKAKKEKKKKCEKVKEKGTKTVGSSARIVEIEEPSDHGGIVLRQVFAKRVDKSKGKRKELSPLDAAVLIQKSFRAYIIRRSQALRSLREMAIAKTKLKEIRGFFHNFSYRRLLARDAEERQRFSEKIIVLLLTVDAIEGADLMVRRAKKSMVDELEAMLDVVDPQPHGKSLSIRRRTFDMPDNAINKELAAGVAQVVQMLDNEANASEAFEACL
ncbi:BCL-2-associated athanogene 7 [Striga asiatica]|uniref:BCL-2-associated athanogene 7 n=1 Tax=Striga asiatica TaxID=4170 RepID=A0A5A7QWV7_STRAF|nr:BCL-2-associated athanogene 7 [Striga asiatica]